MNKIFLKRVVSLFTSLLIIMSYASFSALSVNVNEANMNFAISSDSTYYTIDKLIDITASTEVDLIEYPSQHDGKPVKVSPSLTKLFKKIKEIKYPDVLTNSHPAFDVYEITPYAGTVPTSAAYQNSTLLKVSCKYSGKVKLNLAGVLNIEHIYLHCKELELGTGNNFKNNNADCVYHVANETVKSVLTTAGIDTNKVLVGDFKGEDDETKTVDKSKLQEAISTAQDITTSAYTTSSVAALNKAISDAESVVKKADATEEDVNNALKALETASAIDETGLAETWLKVKASLEGLSRRDKAISTAKQSGEGYTADSYANYKKVYDKLYDLINKSDDITDAQIDSIITELEAAEKLLIEEKIELNLKEYESVKKEIEDILNNDNSSYTKNSLESLKNIYDFQKSMIEDETGKIKDGVLQRRIDTVVDILKRSIDLIDSSCVLVEKGDLTNLKALVESVKDLTESNYTEETWTALSDELTNANALIKDPNNAGKPDVEASEVALKNAIDALSYKSADYTKVDEAIAKVPSDLSKYTDETVKALQNAINAVDKNKNITEQADVDAFAKAIEKAIAGLKLKPASSSQKPGPSTSTKNPGTVSGISGKSSAVKSEAQLKAEKAMNQAKITKLTVKSKAKKTIVVKWNKVKNAKGYQVQVSAKRNFKKLIINKKSVKKNKITIKNKKLKKGRKYFVRVRAYATYKNSKGVTKKAYSSWNKKLRTVKIK